MYKLSKRTQNCMQHFNPLKSCQLHILLIRSKHITEGPFFQFTTPQLSLTGATFHTFVGTDHALDLISKLKFWVMSLGAMYFCTQFIKKKCLLRHIQVMLQSNAFNHFVSRWMLFKYFHRFEVDNLQAMSSIAHFIESIPLFVTVVVIVQDSRFISYLRRTLQTIYRGHSI